MFTRRLGRSGITVSAAGFGTFGFSGVYYDDSFRPGQPISFGDVDEVDAIRVMRTALEAGINFFDTADEYGCGRAEHLLGQALKGRREQAVIATKFGYTYNETTRHTLGTDASPAYIRQACEASLQRLGTDYIDLYLLHLRDLELEKAAEVRDTLELLVQEGKIRWYGWSTDDVERARFFAQGEHCTAVEHAFNLLMDHPEMLNLCDEYDLASVNRVPFLSGILSGTITRDSQLPADDRRSDWVLSSGRAAQFLEVVERLELAFAGSGRTLPQIALGWAWARSERTIPVPGMRKEKYVLENLQALEKGPLTPREMARVAGILAETGYRSIWES